MLRIGQLVQPSYGENIYRITDISGPCTCPEYLRHIDGDDTPSDEHYHLTCVVAARTDGRSDLVLRAGRPIVGYLNGYRPDGTNVWGLGDLTFHGIAERITPDLFAVG